MRGAHVAGPLPARTGTKGLDRRWRGHQRREDVGNLMHTFAVARREEMAGSEDGGGGACGSVAARALRRRGRAHRVEHVKVKPLVRLMVVELHGRRCNRRRSRLRLAAKKRRLHRGGRGRECELHAPFYRG